MFWNLVRRFGILALLVGGSAGAQTLPLSIIGTSAFGPGDCTNNTPVNVSYTYVPPSTVPQNQSIELFATEQSSCPTPDTNSDTVTAPNDAIMLVNANTQPTSTSPLTATLHVSELAAPGGGCGTVQTATWQVCFYEFYLPVNEFGTSSWVDLQNSVTLTYDAQPPGAPEIPDGGVQAGDQQLHITFNPPSDTDIQSYTVLLAPAASVQFGPTSSSSTGGTGSGSSASASSSSSSSVSASSGSTGNSGSDSGSSGSTGSTGSGSSSGSTGSSSSGSTGTPLYGGNACMTGPGLKTFKASGTATTITGPDSSDPLTDGVRYAVQLQAVDNAGNVGPCSNVGYGTPQVIDDFWRLYTQDGGGDTGGCSQAGGLTLLAILGAGLLLARSRRKGRA